MSQLILKYEGEEADIHRIPAYEGAQSLQGLSRSLILVSHFIAEGNVRRRVPYSDNIGIYLRPSREGSWEQLIEFVVANPVTSAAGLVGVNVRLT